MKYSIRYNHTSPTTAGSMREALRKVRDEGRVSRLSHYAAADGLYLWLSRAARERDTDGSRAFAVIERELMEATR